MVINLKKNTKYKKTCSNTSRLISEKREICILIKLPK